MNATHKALVASSASNSPDDFKSIRCTWTVVETPKLIDDQVRIRVHYSSLNFKDALAVTGRGKILRKLPLAPGIDASGVVEDSLSSKFRAGDEVLVTGCGLGETVSGGLSEVVTVPAAWVIPRPARLSLRDCMILGTAGFTAALALHQLEKNDLRPELGEVLVTGATGGVGCLALSLLKSKNYKTVAWTRKKNATESFLNQCGAGRIEDISALDLKTRPLESAIWSAAIDNVGGQVLSYVLPRIQPHGSVASIGLALNADVNTSVFPFILRGVNVLGISSATCPRPLRETIWDLLNSQTWDLNLNLRAEITPREVISECEAMMNGTTWGRVLVNLTQGA